jgi:demethylmenaquinone methyltransferase/2-methoxy-6-polyprenyl-1,4-benzoquinol methylase
MVYLRSVMPVLVRMTGGNREAYGYLAESTRRFLSAEELAAELRGAGFGEVAWRRLMAGAMAIHCGRRPAISL